MALDSRLSKEQCIQNGTNFLGNELVGRLVKVVDDLEVVLLAALDLLEHPQDTLLLLTVLLELRHSH